MLAKDYWQQGAIFYLKTLTFSLNLIPVCVCRYLIRKSCVPVVLKLTLSIIVLSFSWTLEFVGLRNFST